MQGKLLSPLYAFAFQETYHILQPLLLCDCVSFYVLTLVSYSYGRGSDIA